MNISGKTCIVTGANTGLGLAVSKQFAIKKAETILVCRNMDKGEQTISEINKEIPGALVHLMICDLSSLKSIELFIEELKNKFNKIDILYNNAAVMKKKRTITEDGLEIMFQVNYLAPFILMNSLLELLKKGSSPFIINNGRPAVKYRLDLDDLQFEKKYHMYSSFFITKLCLLFASLELSRRKERDDVTVTMIDPGPFKSDLVRDVPLMGWFKNLFSSTVDKAAGNLLYHVETDKPYEKNGRVFKEKQEYPMPDHWKDTMIGERLWSLTESMVKSKIN